MTYTRIQLMSTSAAAAAVDAAAALGARLRDSSPSLSPSDQELLASLDRKTVLEFIRSRREPKPEPHEGRIELFIGPMFAEKTTKMISCVRRSTYAMKCAVIVKWRGDNRYEDGAVVASHSEVRQTSSNGSDHRAGVRVVVADKLEEVAPTKAEMVIGIDEGQFYPDLIQMATKWASEGRRVIIAALDGDSERRPFGQVCALVPFCEVVEKSRGVCMKCRSRESAFSHRIRGGSQVIVIGAAESYEALCRYCYESAMAPEKH